MSATQDDPFRDVVNWNDVHYGLSRHLDNAFEEFSFKKPIRKNFRLLVIYRCCDVIRRLWNKGYLRGSKMRCIKYMADGRFRLYLEFVEFAVKIMKTIIHVDGRGLDKWDKINAEVTDIEYTCALSKKKMEDDHLIKEMASRKLKNIMKRLDYDGIKEMTNNDYRFRNNDTTGETLSILQNFTDKLREMNIIKENYETKTEIARKSKASHRLNLRARDFKPWKLYVSEPIYPIIGKMMHDESDSSTFNTQFIVPEDIGRIITEFVGHDFLFNIKRTNGDKTTLTKDIYDSLSKLRKNELMMIAKKSPYNYINFNKTDQHIMSFDQHIISFASLTKPKLIESIMTSFKNKEQYYPFYRDTIILSRIILDNRTRRLQRERTEMVARWRADHERK